VIVNAGLATLHRTWWRLLTGVLALPQTDLASDVQQLTRLLNRLYTKRISPIFAQLGGGSRYNRWACLVIAHTCRHALAIQFDRLKRVPERKPRIWQPLGQVLNSLLAQRRAIAFLQI
jgi:hypothetical protein